MSLGLDAPMVIETPLMWLDKAAAWGMAHALGGYRFVELVRKETHTCYLGHHQTQHTWGYGCGTCPACELRRDGYESFLAQG